MYLSTNAADYTTSRPFGDESAYNPARDTFWSAMLRAAGTFSGGVALTMVLAILVHH